MLPPLLAGTVLLFPKILGIFIDPLVGNLSDRTRGRFGRRMPYLLGGTIGMSISFVALFHTPDLGSTNFNFVYALIAYFMTSFFYGLFAVPYIAMPSEISTDDIVRTRVVALRMAFVFIGVIIGAALPPLLVSWFNGGRAGYGAMSLVVVALSMPAMLVAAFVVRRLEAPPQTSAVRAFSFTDLAAPLKLPGFAMLLTSYTLLMVSNAVCTSALPYLVVHVLRRPESDIGLFLFAALGTAALTAPLWPRAALRYGTLKALTMAIIFAIVGNGSLMLMSQASNVAIAYAAMIAFGIGTAGIQVFPFALLARQIASAQDQGAPNSEAAITGVWTGCEKLGLALGPALTAVILSLSRFSEGAVAHQNSMALLGIRIASGLMPVIVAILALTGLWRYDKYSSVAK